MTTEERIKNAIAAILSRRYGIKIRGLSADDLMRMAKEVKHGPVRCDQ